MMRIGLYVLLGIGVVGIFGFLLFPSLRFRLQPSQSVSVVPLVASAARAAGTNPVPVDLMGRGNGLKRQPELVRQILPVLGQRCRDGWSLPLTQNSLYRRPGPQGGKIEPACLNRKGRPRIIPAGLCRYNVW